MADPDADVVIPRELAPHPDQIPSWVETPEDFERFRLCFAIGRLICQRDDALFVRQLFRGDIPTRGLQGLAPPD